MYNDKTEQKGRMQTSRKRNLATTICNDPPFLLEKNRLKNMTTQTHSSSRRELTFQQVIEVLEFYTNEQLSPSN